MAARIHQLSKKIGISNRELILLLRQRGFDVRSASSTVDRISAQSLIEEFSDPINRLMVESELKNAQAQSPSKTESVSRSNVSKVNAEPKFAQNKSSQVKKTRGQGHELRKDIPWKQASKRNKGTATTPRRISRQFGVPHVITPLK